MPIYRFILAVTLSWFALNANAQILFQENFDNKYLDSRGWYDFDDISISPVVKKAGKGAYECFFPQGKQVCQKGKTLRTTFKPTDQILLNYWIKYSDNWDFTKPYGHEIYLVTNKDGKYVGPAYSHMTLYIEQDRGKPHLGIQDSKNVDKNCVIFRNGKFTGCNGHPSNYSFNANRSVAACNGRNFPSSNCYCAKNNKNYYSACSWEAAQSYFNNDVPSNKWHHIKVMFKLNDVINDKEIPNGKIVYYLDGVKLISYDNILFRTAANKDMKINQIIIAPYLDHNSKQNQALWIDELVAEIPSSKATNQNN